MSDKEFMLFGITKEAFPIGALVFDAIDGADKLYAVKTNVSFDSLMPSSIESKTVTNM